MMMMIMMMIGMGLIASGRSSELQAHCAAGICWIGL
jgi:hypothetical protein